MDIELSFLHYIITNHIPADLVRSIRPNIKFKRDDIATVVDYLCTYVPKDQPIPDMVTIDYMMGSKQEIIDLLKEATASEPVANDLSDFETLFSQRKIKESLADLNKRLNKAIQNEDIGLVTKLAEELVALGTNTKHRIGPVNMTEFTDIEQLSTPETLLVTEIPRLNQHLGGWPNAIDFEDIGGFSLGELAVIGGSTNAGKSALAQTLWYGFIKKSYEDENYKTVYFNYESAYDRFKKTFFANVTGHYPGRNNKSEIYKSASEEYRKFITPRRNNFLVYDGAGGDMPFTPVSLELELSKKAEEGYKIFFIDTINSIDDAGRTKAYEATERTMQCLERVAKKYNVCVIATAQNKQGLQFEDDKWPELRWIGQSSTLQQKCGVALGIYRADWYSGGTQDFTTIAIMKLRHRSPNPKEGVNVTYDVARRMYVPYRGSETNILSSSELTQNKQILSAINSLSETAYAQV